METTAADGRPARTEEPASLTRPPSRRDGAVIAATSGGLAFAAYLPWLWYATCDGMNCLIAGPAASAFSLVVMPAVAWACWALFRIPRPFRLAVAMVVIDHVLAIAVVNGFGGGFGGPTADGRVIGQAALGPALVYVLAGAFSGLAAIVLVWKGPWSRRVRVGVVALIAAANLAAYTVGARVSGPQLEDRLGQVPVITYLPDISGRVTASGAWDDNGVRITHDFGSNSRQPWEGGQGSSPS